MVDTVKKRPSHRLKGNPLGELRRKAGERYITSLDGISVSELQAIPEFNTVSVSRITSWQYEDSWVAKRKRFLDNYERNFERRIGTKLIQDRIADLRKAESLQKILDATAIETQKDGSEIFKLQPKSVEGWIRAKLDLMEFIDKRRSQLSGEIIGQAGPVQVSTESEVRHTNLHPNLRVKLTEEEAFAIAKVLLEKRRAEVAARMALMEPKKDTNIIDIKPDNTNIPVKKKMPPPGDSANGKS